MVVEEEGDGMDDNHLEVVVHRDTGPCDRVAGDEGGSGVVSNSDTEEDALQDNRSSGSVEHREDNDGSIHWEVEVGKGEDMLDMD